MKLRNWIGMSLAVVGFGLIASGCSKGDNATSNAPAESTGGVPVDNQGKPFVITMIAKSTGNPVFLSAQVGAEAAAKDLTKKLGREVRIDWQTPANEDGQEQAARIQQAVNNHSDAILLSCSDAAKVTGAINDAVDKGVPVMTFDSDAPDSKRFAFYGADDPETGQMVMKELAGQLNGQPANVAILAGNQNAPNLQKRVEGVKEEAKKYPNVKIVDTFYHVETPQDAAAKVLEVMKANPQIKGWAMVGGWPLFTTTLLTDLDPAKVKIVAVDALPAELPYIEKGIAPVLLAQPTYNWGYVSVEKIVDKLINKKDVPVINKMELVRVSKENLNQWAKQLQDWGFTGIDPKYLPAAAPEPGATK